MWTMLQNSRWELWLSYRNDICKSYQIYTEALKEKGVILEKIISCFLRQMGIQVACPSWELSWHWSTYG